MENTMSKAIRTPSGNINKYTVTLVNVADIYDHLGLTDDEVDHIADVAWRNVSYGDSNFTLVGNVYALDQMLDAYEHYHKNTIAIALPHLMMPTKSRRNKKIAFCLS